MNKRGISEVIATVMMIGLVIVVTIIVWGVVQNLATEQLQEAGSCLDVLGKVSLNQQYTCYNGSGNEFLFSVNLADVDVNEVVVTITAAGTTKSYSISREGEAISGLEMYNGSKNILLANKNEGLTYRLDTSGMGKPDSISIYPVIKSKQCDATDSMLEISSCFLNA